jgi:hypothetical protein
MSKDNLKNITKKKVDHGINNRCCGRRSIIALDIKGILEEAILKLSI